MIVQTRQEKRLHMGGVGPRLLALAGHKGKRLREGGVGPEMRSPVGLMTRILPATRVPVKVVLACREQCR
jgi:hypothetical protein